ncbi:cytochrome P450 2K6-like isoform X3 [Ranitomeya imitator]|uniref:cytochrome P450 2K6-like isoform X3 n=1 Tax=Ranitomeya imitator TaxID=111125 RepID=UPI0037E81E12
MSGLDVIALVLFLIIFFLLSKVFYNQKKNKIKNFPPGPNCLPIIGNMLIFDVKNPSKTFTQLNNKFGPVFSVQLGRQKMVVLYGYDAVKDAFMNHAEELSERADIPIFTEATKGYGIVFSNGENWKVMRRFTISTLRDFGMGKKSMEDRISEECNSLVQIFKSYGGKPFENTTIINTAVANVIVSILLGHRYNFGDPSILKLMSLINENFKLLGSPMTMKNPESRRYFHNENLITLVSNLIVAGLETTSTVLRWGLLLMMKYPDIQKNVQREIERVIGQRQPQIEDRKQMPYTDAVIHEIQRFGNIVPAVSPLATTQGIVFRGFFLPKGTHVIPLLGSVLKDKNYFEKPDEFYPEHFLNSQGHFVKNEAFLPFSAGKRRCTGEILAKAELFLFFTGLLQNFSFQAPPDTEVNITPVFGFTNTPMSHKICAVLRHND